MRPHIDIKKVGVAIVDHIKETNESMARFICRLIPVDILCKAKIEDFVKYAKPMVNLYFPQKEDADRIPWCLEFKRRNNDKVIKKEYLDFLCKEINTDQNPVQYDDAKLEIVIEVFRNMLIFAILPGYKSKYRKYNIQQLTSGKAGDDDQQIRERQVIKVADLIK